MSTARIESLLEPGSIEGRDLNGRGYLDLLDVDDEAAAAASGVARTPAQALMRSRALPAIYERWWRPLGSRLMLSPGMGIARERRIALELLELNPGDAVLDVACGPGNFTRAFGDRVGDDGLAVGLDASETMLERALAEDGAGSIAYVRGDASRLPFREQSFDAVCCFAALYLFAQPFRAIDEMVRVLRPGGRIAVLTSCRPAPEPLGLIAGATAGLSGVRVFGRDEITDALRGHGMVAIEQQVRGLAQIVGARRAEERAGDA